MVDKALSSLAVVSSADTGDLVYIVQGGNSRQAKVSTLLAANPAVVAVEDYGAVGDGTTDDTAAIQAAIDAVDAIGGGVVRFRARDYKFTSTLTISANYTTLQGEGSHATVLSFSPTANDTAIAIGDGVNVINQIRLSGFSLYSPDTTFTKIGIEASDVHVLVVDHLTIYGADSGVAGTDSWGGGSSIGVRTLGRDFLYLDDTVTIAAERPILISNNPNHTIDFDHCRVCAYLIADNNPCIEAEDGVFFSNSTFSGAWAGGTDGFKFVSTSGATSYHLCFRDIRTEQGQSTTDYSFNIDGFGAIQSLSFHNIMLDPNRNGIKLRDILDCGMYGVTYVDTTKEALNVDSTVQWLEFHNCWWNAGSTATFSGLNCIYKSQVFLSSGPLPGSAVYSSSTARLTSDNITANTLSRTAAVTETGATHTVAATTTHLICNQAGTTTVTLPAASSFSGRELYIKTITANTVVSASSNVVPSTSDAAGTAILPATDGAWAHLVSDGTNWVIMAANPLV